jgi:hypothetical protein
MKEIDNRKCLDMIDEGDISDILLLQLAEMMECEAKRPDISHMDLLYVEIDDITVHSVLMSCNSNPPTHYAHFPLLDKPEKV